MTRRVAVVLGLTFLALVAATLWVPTWEEERLLDGNRHDTGRVNPSVKYVAIWHAMTQRVPVQTDIIRWDPGVTPDPTAGFGAVRIRRVQWALVLASYIGIAALGALLALVLRTRQARGAA